MTEWSSFLAPFRRFLAQSPQVTIRIGLSFCVWSILVVGYPHAENFLPTRHRSGDMTDGISRKFEKSGHSVISPLSKYQHWHLGLPDSATTYTNWKNFSPWQKFLVQNDGKNDGYDEKLTFITKKWRLWRVVQKNETSAKIVFEQVKYNKKNCSLC